MSRRVGGATLVFGFIRHRLAQVMVLLLLGFVLGAAVIGVASVRSSAEKAISDSLRADLAGRSFALQTGNPEAIESLAGIPDAAPVQDEQGNLSSGDLTAPVLVRATTDPALHLGVLIGGEWPSRAGDVIVSETLATAFGISLGDSVGLRAGGIETTARVVGFSVDPADNNARIAVLLLPTDSDQFVPTRWLRDADFYDLPALQPALDRRTATYQSLDTLLDAAAENRPHFLSAMRFVPTGLGLLLGVLVLAASAAFGRRWTRDVSALTAAGMAAAQAWRRVLAIAAGSVALGEVAGGVAVVALLRLVRGSVSSWIGQQWVSVAVPWPTPVILLVLTALAAVLALPLVRLVQWASGYFARVMPHRSFTTPAALTAALLAAVVWVVAIRSALRPGDDGAAGLAPLAAVVIAGAIPFVLAPALGWAAPVASRSIVRHLHAGMKPVAAVAAVVVVSSGIWAAQTTAEANVGESMSSPLEPAGSFVISEMPDSAVDALKRSYATHGGSDVVTYQIPDESTANLRATGPQLVACMSERKTSNPDEVPEDCFPQQAASPINTVMLGEPGTAPRADPTLIQEGKVGLLLFTGNDGRATRLADTSATPDPVLGGNLPGLVIPPDSNVAREFNLAAGGTSEVVLLDFSTLTPNEQFLVRSAVMRLAPSAQTADGTDPTAYDRLRSVANTVSFLGAAGAVVLTLLGGLAMVVAHTLVRRILLDLGSAPRPRWSITARWIALPILSTVTATALAYLTASLGGQRTGASYGVLWYLPGAVTVIAAFALAFTFLRVPPTANE